MTDTEALTALKRRLDISTNLTDLDEAIKEFANTAAKRLYPFAQNELPFTDVNVSTDSFGEVNVNLSAITGSPDAARYVEASEGSYWFPVENTFHHGSTLRVRELSSSVTQLRIYGLKAYTLADAPNHLHNAIYWYAMAEFYDFLSGNKSKYNVFMSNNARAVDNMREESEYYENKANIFLNDHATIYGMA